MTTMTTTKPLTDQEILALEHDFWSALKERDGRAAARLTAEDSTVVGASGVSGISPRAMGQMTESASYRIKDFRIDRQSARITHLCDDAYAVSYPVHEDVEVDGKPVTLEAYDTSVWKKTDAGWACVLHTESIAGDAFGRDRTKGFKPS